MKKLFLSFAVLLVAAGSYAQVSGATETTAAAPVVKAEDLIKFKETTHDFGKIKQGVPLHTILFLPTSARKRW